MRDKQCRAPVDVPDKQSEHCEGDDDRVRGTKRDVDDDEKQSLRSGCVNGQRRFVRLYRHDALISPSNNVLDNFQRTKTLIHRVQVEVFKTTTTTTTATTLLINILAFAVYTTQRHIT